MLPSFFRLSSFFESFFMNTIIIFCGIIHFEIDCKKQDDRGRKKEIFENFFGKILKKLLTKCLRRDTLIL